MLDSKESSQENPTYQLRGDLLGGDVGGTGHYSGEKRQQLQVTRRKLETSRKNKPDLKRTSLRKATVPVNAGELVTQGGNHKMEKKCDEGKGQSLGIEDDFVEALREGGKVPAWGPI